MSTNAEKCTGALAPSGNHNGDVFVRHLKRTASTIRNVSLATLCNEDHVDLLVLLNTPVEKRCELCIKRPLHGAVHKNYIGFPLN